jgi:hypothetical protein
VQPMSGAIYADGPSVYNYAGFCPAGGVHNNAGSGEYSLATGPPPASPPGSGATSAWASSSAETALAFARRSMPRNPGFYTTGITPWGAVTTTSTPRTPQRPYFAAASGAGTFSFNTLPSVSMAYP